MALGKHTDSDNRYGVDNLGQLALGTITSTSHAWALGSKPIFIVGYMGSGKSTVGRLLAEKLGFRFIDTDIFIETRFRRRVLDIFNEEGEETFRRRERVVLEELSGMTNCVIATGGGLPCYSDNMSLMNECGTTVYLDVSDHALAVRLELCKRTRPTVKDKTGDDLLLHISEAMCSRRPIYSTAAIICPAEKLVDRYDEEYVADAIVALLLRSCATDTNHR